MNTAMACAECNNAKGDQSLLEFYLNDRRKAKLGQRVWLQRIEGLIDLDEQCLAKKGNRWNQPLFALLDSM